MGVIEFDLTRTVHAGIKDVFAHLSDINGHNEWMPKGRSMLRRTRQTSASRARVSLVGQVQGRQAQTRTYGIYRLATPFLRRMAKKERTVTLDALAASFDEPSAQSAL